MPKPKSFEDLAQIHENADEHDATTSEEEENNNQHLKGRVSPAAIPNQIQFQFQTQVQF